MHPYEYEVKDGQIVGWLPSQEQRTFNTLAEYNTAYYEDLNDIIDGLAELDEEMRILDWPEDWAS